MRWLRHRHGEQDTRVEQARAAAESAAAEVEVSLRREEAVRRHVVEPLRRAAEHNMFAELIRRSLTGGREGENT